MRACPRHALFSEAVTRRSTLASVAMLGFTLALRFFLAAPRTTAQSGANADTTYAALRNVTLGSEAVSVTNLDLKRDAGTLHLNSGTVCFVTPVNGKVTGAVFTGDGNFTLSPPDPAEVASLRLFTKQDEFNERFLAVITIFLSRAPTGTPTRWAPPSVSLPLMT